MLHMSKFQIRLNFVDNVIKNTVKNISVYE